MREERGVEGRVDLEGAWDNWKKEKKNGRGTDCCEKEKMEYTKKGLNESLFLFFFHDTRPPPKKKSPHKW